MASSSQKNQVVIVGPSKSGKTTYLAALQVAAHQRMGNRTNEGGERWVCNVCDMNTNMRRISNQSRQIVLDGECVIPATDETHEYEFQVELSRGRPGRRGLFGLNAIRQGPRFCAIDGPGGSIFGTATTTLSLPVDQLDKYRKTLVEKARGAQGLLLCVDSTDEDACGDYFLDLPDFLEDIGRPLPFQRIVILLTKAEKMVLHERDAMMTLFEKSAGKHARHLLVNAIETLKSYLRGRSSIACGWCSTFGFVPGEGTPNYDPKNDSGNDRLLTVREGMTTRDKIASWEPFRLLDPVVYLATGDQTSLEII